jgi:RNAse (barnase) inhibitor barstar
MQESDLFDLLKKEFILDLEKSKDQFSRWDCVSHKFAYRIELKCRKTHYNKLMLERDKYFALILSYVETGYKPLYINSTPKGVYVFDLSELNPEWTTDTRMPKTTDFDNNNRVKKTYTLLEIKNAKKIN